MIISIIAAVAHNGVIGINGTLPWKLPDDMKQFVTITIGHHIIMGRKTYQSLPQQYKPLPGRTNIVTTRQSTLSSPPHHIVTSLKEGILLSQQCGEQELFVIGGSQMYQAAIPLAHRMYITKVDAHLDGDVFFPNFKKDDWTTVSSTHHDKDARHIYAFDFVCYHRKQ